MPSPPSAHAPLLLLGSPTGAVPLPFTTWFLSTPCLLHAELSTPAGGTARVPLNGPVTPVHACPNPDEAVKALLGCRG